MRMITALDCVIWWSHINRHTQHLNFVIKLRIAFYMPSFLIMLGHTMNGSMFGLYIVQR